MKLKNLLKFGLPILGISSLAISLPLALTSCGAKTSNDNNESNKNINTQELQSNFQSEITKKSNFLYYYFSSQQELKKLVSEASSKQITQNNIKSVSITQTNTNKKDIDSTTNYKVDLQVELNDPISINGEQNTKFKLSNIDTGIQQLSQNNQNIVPTNLNENLLGVAKYLNKITNFDGIGASNCSITTSNSGKTEVQLKEDSEIYKNICYLLNVNKDLIGKISFVASQKGDNQTSFNLFIALKNGNNWNKDVLKITNHGASGTNSVTQWYGEIKVTNQNTMKFLYQTNNNNPTYGKDGNILGIYTFDISGVPNPSQK